MRCLAEIMEFFSRQGLMKHSSICKLFKRSNAELTEHPPASHALGPPSENIVLLAVIKVTLALDTI